MEITRVEHIMNSDPAHARAPYDKKYELELAAAVGLKTEVTRVTADQLRDADEAFLTFTAGGVMPVSLVDGTPLGGRNNPGPLATQLHNLYWQKRWTGWLGTAIDYESP